ncbi:hypothetical protein [Mesotoga sp. UBA6090]|uniref:hypothetical protein n=1 Tax=Mesotoga sp. UBA6090 TaxID=1946860 RepID=UPI0025D5FC7B|nr:hypothetical protein [Mesotoga sp. UBA6090]
MEALQHDDTVWYVVKAYAENIKSDVQLRKVLNDLKDSAQRSLEKTKGLELEKHHQRLLDIVQQSLRLLGGEE